MNAPQAPKYYVYDSPMKGMGKRRYFPTLKAAKIFQKTFFPYPMVEMKIYKVKEERAKSDAEIERTVKADRAFCEIVSGHKVKD